MDLSTARHAFVTGGASGIGLGIAEALARRGVGVTIADIDRPALDAASAGRFQAVALDVRDRAAWTEGKAQAERALGPVDILVNNAGIGPDGQDLADMDPASFDRIIAINLTGVFNGVSAFAAGMRACGAGHIVNTASEAGLMTIGGGLGGYTVAKFGVVALSEILRIELAPHGVGVSVLCPGLVATNLRATTAKLGSTVRQGSNAGLAVMQPATAGEIVANGIARNLSHIITHPEDWPMVEMRMKVVREAFVAAEGGV
jgi:NAD(P)-dependent dehydrogenase (short-subunit alcohol dehydrogenase family)